MSKLASSGPMRRASTGVVPGTWWSTASRVVSASSTPARWPRLGDQDQRDGEARALRGGQRLHGFSLSWLDCYAHRARQRRANTRREYRRCVNFALTTLTARSGCAISIAPLCSTSWIADDRSGRRALCDRSIANALTPLRLALEQRSPNGLLDANRPTGRAAAAAGGSRMSTSERRFLTRAGWCGCSRGTSEVAALFELLPRPARISEALGLRWSDSSREPQRICRCSARSTKAQWWRPSLATARG